MKKQWMTPTLEVLDVKETMMFGKWPCGTWPWSEAPWCGDGDDGASGPNPPLGS